MYEGILRLKKSLGFKTASMIVLTWLVVEPTHLKNMLVKMGIFPNFRGENKKSLSCHHLETIDTWFLFSLIFVLHSIKNPSSIEKKNDKLKETKT